MGAWIMHAANTYVGYVGRADAARRTTHDARRTTQAEPGVPRQSPTLVGCGLPFKSRVLHPTHPKGTAGPEEPRKTGEGGRGSGHINHQGEGVGEEVK